MKSILVKLSSRSYSIFLENSFNNIAQGLQTDGKKNYHKILIVTHPKLQKIYGAELLRGLESVSKNCAFTTINEGEESKSPQTVLKLYQACLKNKLDRGCAIVALGGGVVGDVAGFVAGTWLRGIDIIHVPTTLLAMVDSSIGGKTGIDLPMAKNSVGAFHQPRLVWINPNTLNTLAERELTNGMAEVIKYGVIKDAKLFEQLQNFDQKNLQEIIYRCAAIKAEVVSKDERETKGLREILNYGHTIGHAIEAVTKYKVYKHGEAVAIGMCAAANIAQKRGLLKTSQAQKIEALIQQFKLPTRLQKTLPLKAIEDALGNDKKVLSGKWRFVLPKKIGQVIVEGILPQEAMQGYQYVQNQ